MLSFHCSSEKTPQTLTSSSILQLQMIMYFSCITVQSANGRRWMSLKR